jgi:hypothetical protein
MPAKVATNYCPSCQSCPESSKAADLWIFANWRNPTKLPHLTARLAAGHARAWDMGHSTRRKADSLVVAQPRRNAKAAKTAVAVG